jgi:hypothetical protein
MTYHPGISLEGTEKTIKSKPEKLMPGPRFESRTPLNKMQKYFSLLQNILFFIAIKLKLRYGYTHGKIKYRPICTATNISGICYYTNK